MKNSIFYAILFNTCLLGINKTIVAQEVLLFSYTHDYMLGRFDDPVENKYSPDWKKLEPYNLNEIIPAPYVGFPLLNPDSNENNLEWIKLTSSLVKSMILEPHNYGDFAEKDDEIFPFMIAYGLIANGNYKDIYEDGFMEKANTLFTYFTKEENAIKLLVYLKPTIVWSLSCMSGPSRDGYKTILKEAQKYITALKKPDFYDAEIKFCKKKESFAYRNAKGKTDNCRRIKAFIFRRYVDYEAKNWSPKQIATFEKDTDYLPKPNWGMSLAAMQQYGKLMADWF